MKWIRQFVLVGAAAALVLPAGAQSTQVAATDPDISTATPPSADLSAIPPIPRGESTILGGAIRNVDPVLDRFTLRIVGEKPMRILFDERTQVFLDGKKIPLRDLRPSEHASVQTTLDGTSVFAISVHILSQLQEGAYQGEVVSYDPTTGNLNLVSGRGGEPILVKVSSETRFDRKGQKSFASDQTGASDLRPGALVSLQFEPDGRGRADATQITFLATPGSQFVFGGNLIALDMHTGTMVLLDPMNEQTYQISFNPVSLSNIQRIHAGQRVRVSTEYDGTRYVARVITLY
jgi:hypothetical protein